MEILMNDVEDKESRRHKRIPFNQEVEVRGQGIYLSVELSIGGMYLKTIEPYLVGDILDLQFKLIKADEHPINVHSYVLYTHKRIGVGLGFLNLRSEDHERLDQFIEREP